MLSIDKISHTAVYSEDWHKERLGKITASRIGELMSAKSHDGKFTQTALSYLEDLAGEVISSRPAKDEFFTDATNHGNAHEPEAVSYFVSVIKKQVLRNDNGDTHRLIKHNAFCACTPDALVCEFEDEKMIFDSTGTKINVFPLEVKCPLVHNRFIKLFRCKEPFDLLKAESDYFYQVISQIYFCGTLKGYFAAYNPYFEHKMRIIEFRKIYLREEFDRLEKTITHATNLLQTIIQELKTAA